MRVLHVITSLYIGGAETLVVNMMPRFQERGYEVGVVVFNGTRTSLMERLEKECPHCKIYRLGNSFYNPWYIVKLIRVMRKYTLIHTHNSSAQLYVAMANIFCHKKLVTTEHNTNNRKRGNYMLSVIDKWMYTKYHKIICISGQAEENMRKYLHISNDTSKRICTIYNGINVKAFYEALAIDDMKTDQFVIVMVAAFRPQKDQATLIRAVKELPEGQYKVWLVGDGECRNNIEKLVKQLKVERFVKFWGLRTDVPNILKSADVVVMSTHYEGLSLSSIEGMASGKPFIASDVEGIHEVTSGYGILVPHGDAKTLAKTIQRLHDNSDYYQQVAATCYERAKQFDINRMVEQYDKIYLSL